MARTRRMRVEPLEDRRMLAASFTCSYSQNFDSLPTSGTNVAWANDTTIDGWYLFRQPAPGTAITTINAGTGSSNAGSFYSFGNNADRAIGGLGSGGTYFDSPASGAVAGWMALALDNDTGSTIDELYFNYTGEQWRKGSNSAQTMTVQYGFGATFETVSSWSAKEGFNFRSVSTGSNGAKNGNSSDNRREDIDGLLTDLSWTAGNTLWIRWVENNDTGEDHGLAIDDLQINTLPTFVVDTLVDEDDGDHTSGDLSLREALAIATSWSIIEFDPSLTSGGPASIVLTQGVLEIDQNLLINGPGADLLTIDASGNDPTPGVDNSDGSGVFLVDPLNVARSTIVTFSGLTLTGSDGAPAVSGIITFVTLDSCKIVGNHGGAVHGGTVVINDCEITGNSGSSTVAGYDIRIAGTTISNNQGRGIDLLYGDLTIADSTISGNTAATGAAIFLGYEEGDIYFPGLFSTATITNTVISGNTATMGSAIFGTASKITLVDSTVSGNLGGGAAISNGSVPFEYYGSTLTLENTDVVNNEGGGISLAAYRVNNVPELRIVDSDISGNGGTGVSFFGGDETIAEIFDSSINNNARGVFLYGDSGDSVVINIERSEINDSVSGGGVTLLGAAELEITDTTISGNHNTVSGGGIRVSQYATLSLLNSTISGNSTTGDGGGVWLNEYTNARISLSTIANNTAGGSGGGVAFNSTYDSSPDALEISGSIIGNNTAGSEPDILPPEMTWSINYSLVENPGSATIGGTGNIVGVDPVLGPLADNGGPTFTHALLAGSPAIEAGDPNAIPGIDGVPLYDQRGVGFDRLRDSNLTPDIAIDMGAYEVQAAAPVSGDFDGDGDVDGRDFLLWQRGGSPSPLSSGDLEDWRDNYGTSSLSAVSSEYLASQESSVESLEPENSDLGLMISDVEDGEDASGEEVVFQDQYAEEVDRAFEQLAAVPSATRGFGELVTRRAKPRAAMR